MSVISSGHELAGRYRLDDVLGRGAMGTVWRGHDETLDRPVAVKEVQLRAADDDLQAELCLRTEREAYATAMIDHPSVVSVYDVVTADDRPWIVMELLQDAKSLEELSREHGQLPPQYVAEIGRQVVGALRTAHAKGILHRDVKPSNILITQDGRAVLTDFGIAAIEGAAPITMTNVVVGSAGYVAPERTIGGRAGPKSDLWGLGVTMYTAVAGPGPQGRRAAMAALVALADDRPIDSEHVGPLRPIIEGLLRRDPAERIDGALAERMLTRVATGDSALPADRNHRDRERAAMPLPRGHHRRQTDAPRPTGRHGRPHRPGSATKVLIIGLIALVAAIALIVIAL